jgi:hypothetical protein
MRGAKVLAVLMILNVIGTHLLQKDEAKPLPPSVFRKSTTPSAAYAGPVTPSTLRIASPLPPNEDPEVSDALDEVFAEHRELIEIAKIESHKNQWEWTDGKPDHTRPLRARDPKTGQIILIDSPLGVMQIKPEHIQFCSKKAGRDIDLAILEDNLECAILLYNDRGLAPWWHSGMSIIFDVTVKDEKWTKPLWLPKETDAILDFEQDVQVMANGDESRWYMLGPGRKVDMGTGGRFLQFRTERSTVGHIHYIAKKALSF